jgi:ribonuclease P protein component
MPEKRDETFPRESRLRKSTDFKRVFSKGKRTAARHFIIYSLPNRLLFSRLGIQVRAKIGKAPRRNYIKRIVRETFRKMKGEFVQPVDLVFIAEKAILELDYSQFAAEFRKALTKYLK